MRAIIKHLFGYLAEHIFAQLLFSAPVSYFVAWGVEYVRPNGAPMVLSSFSLPPLFMPVFMAVLFLITFHPAVIAPIKKSRQAKRDKLAAEQAALAAEREAKEEAEENKKKVFINKVETILRGIQICLDRGFQSSTETTFIRMMLEVEIAGIYSRIKKYNPPENNVHDRKTCEQWREFLLDLRTKLEDA